MKHVLNTYAAVGFTSQLQGLCSPVFNEALELQTVGDDCGRFLDKYIHRHDQQTKKNSLVILMVHTFIRTCTDMSRGMKETICPGLLRKAATLIASHWVFLRACDTALGAP